MQSNPNSFLKSNFPSLYSLSMIRSQTTNWSNFATYVRKENSCNRVVSLYKMKLLWSSATASKKHKKERKFVCRVVTSCSERMNKKIFFREINYGLNLKKCVLVSYSANFQQNSVKSTFSLYNPNVSWFHDFFPNVSNRFVKLQTSDDSTKISSISKWFHEKSFNIKVGSFTNELKVVI